MNTIVVAAFYLFPFLLVLPVHGVPTIPSEAAEFSKQLPGLVTETNEASIPAAKGDMLDNTFFGKYKQRLTESYNEKAELWKYVRKEQTSTDTRDLPTAKLLPKQVRPRSSQRQFEILKPFLPPHNFLIPSESLLTGTPEPYESEMGPSPETSDYPTSSPYMAPDDDIVYSSYSPMPDEDTVYPSYSPMPDEDTVYPSYSPMPDEDTVYPSYSPILDDDTVYPSHSPIPDDSSRQTFPSLATVDNERGEITYRPWDSVYVVVRRFFNMGVPLKKA